MTSEPLHAVTLLARTDTLDTRTLVPEKVSVAAELARRFGCRLRITVQDGRTIRYDAPTPRVIDVTFTGDASRK